MLGDTLPEKTAICHLYHFIVDFFTFIACSSKTFCIFAEKYKMNDDVFESVSQRGRGEEIAENRRIYEISDELVRRSQLYEAQLRDGQKYISRFEA